MFEGEEHKKYKGVKKNVGLIKISVVKLRLFQSYCICLYDSALWNNFTVAAINRLASCYVKCMKAFFGSVSYTHLTLPTNREV